jgi:hypothetical protein
MEHWRFFPYEEVMACFAASACQLVPCGPDRQQSKQQLSHTTQCVTIVQPKSQWQRNHPQHGPECATNDSVNLRSEQHLYF